MLSHLRFLIVVISLASACQTNFSAKKSGPHLTQGNQYAKDGLYKEAITSYLRELKNNPEDATVNRNLGIVYLKTSNYKKAASHLKKSMPAYSTDHLTNFYIAESYRAQREFSEAIFHYRKTLELSPGFDKALKALAWSYYQTRSYAEALRTIQKMQALSPNDSQTAIIAARILIKSKASKKALSTIQKALAFSQPEDIAFLHSAEGDIYLALDDCQSAEKSYRAALQKEPLLAGALLGLGKCLLKTSDKVDQAIAYMERATRLKPSLAEGFYLLGKSLENTNPDQSLKYYAQFKKVASGNPEFRKQLQELKHRPPTTPGRRLKSLSNEEVSQ
jgi:tetratricopeptide (TPR) repeat protein